MLVLAPTIVDVSVSFWQVSNSLFSLYVCHLRLLLRVIIKINPAVSREMVGLWFCAFVMIMFDYMLMMRWALSQHRTFAVVISCAGSYSASENWDQRVQFKTGQSFLLEVAQLALIEQRRMLSVLYYIHIYSRPIWRITIFPLKMQSEGISWYDLLILIQNEDC